MACGTPVINTHIDSGVPFVSLHNVSGITVPPADVAALRQAITSVLDDEVLLARLSQGARRRVEELFTTRRMAEATVELYEEVLAGGGKRAMAMVASGRGRTSPPLSIY
jgi:rhamnosyl/mannosyltransferase